MAWARTSDDGPYSALVSLGTGVGCVNTFLYLLYMLYMQRMQIPMSNIQQYVQPQTGLDCDYVFFEAKSGE